MMQRDFGQLKNGPFDLLVIGGGIYGAWIAYDAALRGLSVALVEKKDWASGTSQASSKLIHGGLRYLEYFRFDLVKKGLKERTRLLHLAPHRVYPLRFVLPVYKTNRVGPFRLKLGLWLYDRLAGKEKALFASEFMNRETLLGRYPFLTSRELSGAFTYGDSTTDDARFTLEIVAGAANAGAVAVNHARVSRLLITQNRVAGARVVDEETSEELEVQASITVSATGPWAGYLSEAGRKGKSRIRLTKGVHLVLPGLPTREAFLLTAKSDGRVFFLIPWYGRTLLGTTDTDFSGQADKAGVEPENVRYLLDAANHVLNGGPWKDSDIRGAFAGVRTLRDIPGYAPSSLSREWILERPRKNLLLPIGGKFTSARMEAAYTVDRIMQMGGQSPKPCSTLNRPFPWCPTENFEDWERQTTQTGLALGLDKEAVGFCIRRFGSTITDLFSILKEHPSLKARIHPEAPFIRAEFVHAVKNEMAVTLDDILRRRIPLSILGYLSRDILKNAADLAEKMLNWSPQRKEKEIQSMKANLND